MRPARDDAPASKAAPRRRLVMGLALAGTLVATFWALDDEGEPPSAVADRQAAARPPGPVAAPAIGPGPGANPPATQPLALLPRERPRATPRDLFAPFGPALPTLLPVAAAASAVAIVPSLPYAFGGRLITAAGASVLLNDGGQTHLLAIGQTLGDFRFEGDGGAQLDFIHLPSGERVHLAADP